ncbi:MAG: adenylate/guanylate cyclase domain-containing protein [Candidatus Dojkabacteria bacterium]
MRVDIKSILRKLIYFFSIAITTLILVEISDKSFFTSINNFIARVLNFYRVSEINIVSLTSINIRIANFSTETSSVILIIILGLIAGVIYLLSRNFIVQTTFYLVTLSLNLMVFVISISSGNLWPFLQIIFLSSVGYIATIFLNYFEKMLKIVQMQQALGTFVNKKVSEDLLNGSKLRVSGAEKDISVMFIDIREFTSLTENMKAKDLIKFLNGYLSFMSNLIIKNGGTIDKYIGDSVMALWNAPEDIKFHAYNSVIAALEIVQNMKEFQNKNPDLPKIQIGVGISTGKTIVGNIGTEVKLNYTVIGDNVNLASRIEGLTKKYGLPMLLADTTYEECVGCPLLFREVDTVLVKGRKKSLKLYEPMINNSKNKKIKEIYEKALKYYYQKKFDEARDLFVKIEDNDGPSKTMHRRIFELSKDPSSFKGVWKWSDK